MTTRKPLGSAKGTVPWNKDRDLPAEPLTPAEADALIAACPPKSATGQRNRALITALYRGGLRISECLDLKPSDFSLDRGTIRVLDGKGHKPRTVGIDPGAAATIARWIDTRKSLGVRGGRPLFCTVTKGDVGGPMSRQYVSQLLKRLAKRAGIDKRVHPHGLRHSHAVDLVDERVALPVISKQLGHKTIAITSTYVDHIAPADVIATMKRRQWEEPK